MTGTRIDRRGFLRNAGGTALGAAAAGSIAQLTPSALARSSPLATSTGSSTKRRVDRSTRRRASSSPTSRSKGSRPALTMCWERAGESHARSSTLPGRMAT